MKKHTPLDTFNEAFKKVSSLNMTPDFTFQINKSGILIDFSKHKKNIHNLFPEELKGQHINAILPTEEAKIILDAVDRAITTRSLQYIEFSLIIEGKSCL